MIRKMTKQEVLRIRLQAWIYTGVEVEMELLYANNRIKKMLPRITTAEAEFINTSPSSYEYLNAQDKIANLKDDLESYKEDVELFQTKLEYINLKIKYFEEHIDE